METEDYDVQSLATYLHLTPDQIRKMAERGRLPGRRVAGQWRFSPAEIHEWFEKRIGVSDEQELDQVEKVLDASPQAVAQDALRIADLLDEANIQVPFMARTKSSVIQRICDLGAVGGKLWEPDKMAEAIQSREELHPTALENGVALLHPRRPMSSIVGEPFLALGITSTGIPFGGPRGCLTDIFFLIGSTSETLHLRLLARLSRLIQQPDLLAALRAAEDPRQARQAIAEFDSELD